MHPDHIRSRIEINAKDFVHYYPLGPITGGIAVTALRDAVLEHRQHLLENFIIRDARGERLRGKCVDVQWDELAETKISYSQLGEIRAIYVLEWPTRTPPRYLTFQQFLGAGRTSTPIRLALSVTAADCTKARFIQLTNRGNVETLNVGRRRDETTQTD